MQEKGFTKEELLLDAMLSEQYLAILYNRASGCTASIALRSEWVNLLTEEHQMHYELLMELQKRGWDNTQPHSG